MTLFDIGKKTNAVFLEGYIGFDEKDNFAVQILDENKKEVDMQVFESKEQALNFIKKHNQ